MKRRKKVYRQCRGEDQRVWRLGTRKHWVNSGGGPRPSEKKGTTRSGNIGKGEKMCGKQQKPQSPFREGPEYRRTQERRGQIAAVKGGEKENCQCAGSECRPGGKGGTTGPPNGGGRTGPAGLRRGKKKKRKGKTCSCSKRGEEKGASA